MTAYDRALQDLYRAPIAKFLAERKRLADELRSQGDRSGATQLARRRKPTASVWAVNQIYWRARDAFDEMLATAKRLRKGDLTASKNHHRAIARLRMRGAALLKDAGLGASDATLRRIGTTLSSIAAAGGFDPDPPGALTADRDAPGFEAVGISAGAIDRESQVRRSNERPAAIADDDRHARKAARDHAAAKKDRERAVAAQRRAAQLAERKQKAERARLEAERERLQKAIRAASTDLQGLERKRAALERQLGAAEKSVSEARAVLEDLERRMVDLERGVAR